MEEPSGATEEPPRGLSSHQTSKATVPMVSVSGNACSRQCVFMCRAIPVFREEHRPPFLVFCDDSSLEDCDFLRVGKKREVVGDKQKWL